MNKSYQDEGKTRTDKIYYTTTHSYESSFKTEDVLRILNPSDGRLGSLFEDTTVNKGTKSGTFKVMMNISTPLKDFNCESILTFKKSNNGNKHIFTYAY